MVIAVSDGAPKLDSIGEGKTFCSIRYTIEIICADFKAYTAYIGIYFSFILKTL